jgi:parvulin-like peptidyl-prolyl isomerase
LRRWIFHARTGARPAAAYSPAVPPLVAFRIRLAVLCGIACLAGGALRAAGPTNQPVATARGFTVTRAELAAAVERREAEAAARTTRVSDVSRDLFVGSTLDDLIMQHMCALRATDADRVRAQAMTGKILDERITEAGDEDALAGRLVRIGTTLAEFRKSVFANSLVEAVVEREVGDSLVITDEMMRTHYDNHPQDRFTVESARILQLLVSTRDQTTGEDLPTEQKNEKLRLARDLRRRATEGGEDFKQLIRRYSEDPISRNAAGAANIVSGHAVFEVETAAFTLPLNTLSDVVQSTLGFHLIQVLEHKKPELVSFEAAATGVRKELRDAGIKAKLPEFTAKLRAEYEVQLAPDAPKPIWARESENQKPALPDL